MIITAKAYNLLLDAYSCSIASRITKQFIHTKVDEELVKVVGEVLNEIKSTPRYDSFDQREWNGESE